MTQAAQANQPQVAPAQSPIQRWAIRHMQNGGDVEDTITAMRLLDELLCASSIAETIAPGMFDVSGKVALRDCLSEARSTLADLDVSELDAHARVIDAQKESPFGQWILLVDERRRSVTDPNQIKLLALDAAAARDFYADFKCAQAVGRTFSGGPLSTTQAIEFYKALIDHKERFSTNSDPNVPANV